MRSRFSHCVVVVLTVCMLWMIFAMPVLAQDVTTPTDLSGAKGTPAPDTQQSASPAPTEAADPLPQVVGFDTSALPEGFAVAYGTAEAALGLPAELTAIFSDNTTAPVAVTWACVSDGLGGTAYNPLHENIAEAYFVFQAALAEDMACQAELPQVCVVFADGPAVLADTPTLAELGILGAGSSNISGTSSKYIVSLNYGAFTISEGVKNCSQIIVSNDTELTINAPISAEVMAYDNSRIHVNASCDRLDAHNNCIVDINGSGTNIFFLNHYDNASITASNCTINSLYSSGDSGKISLTNVSDTTFNVETVSGANITLNRSTVSPIFGSITVNSGSLTMENSVINGGVLAEGGSVTMSGSGTSINYLNVSGSAEVKVSEGATVSDTTSLNGGNFTASNANFSTVIINGGACDIRSSNITGDLSIDKLPTSGSISLDGINTEIYIEDTVFKDMLNSCPDALTYVPANVSLKDTITIPVDNTNFGNINLSYPSLDLVYKKTDWQNNVAPGTNVSYLVYFKAADGQIISGATVTLPARAELYLSGGTITKTYDASCDFTAAAVANPAWVTANGASYTGEIPECTVTVNATTEDANAGANMPATVSSITITDADNDANVVLVDSTTYATALTATINKAPVTLSGTIWRNGDDDQLTWSEARQYVTADGLQGEDTIEALGDDIELNGSISGDNGITELGNVLLSKINNGSDVSQITQNSESNYSITQPVFLYYQLHVAYRYKTSTPRVSMENWFIIGDQSEFNEPTIVEGTIGDPNRPVTFEYRKDGSTEWTTDKPETPGRYYVRAQVGAYNEYLPETTSDHYFVFSEFSINMSFDGHKEEPPTIKQGETVNVRTYVEPQTTDSPAGTFRFNGTMSFVADDRDESFTTSKFDDITEYAYMATLPTDLEPGIRTITANYSVDLEGKTYTMSAQKDIKVLRNISAGFGCSELSLKGSYAGAQYVPNESSKIVVNWHPDKINEITLDLTKCKLSFIKRSTSGLQIQGYYPTTDELTVTKDQIIFTPLYAGIYYMTISYQNEQYFAEWDSITALPNQYMYVEKRPITLKFKDMTIEKGNSLVPEYEIVEGSLAAGDEIKLDNFQFTDSSATPVDSTDASTLETGDYRFTAEVSIYNAQGDDVSNQYSVKKTYENDAENAALTVENPRTSIAVSYDEASVSLQTIEMQLRNKNMSNRKTTWTPLLIGDTEWVRSQSEGGIHFVAKDELGRYVSYDTAIGDNYTVTWYDEQGNQMTAIPTDAGTYTMKIALTGTAADQYALRYMVNGTTTADTLTFTIPKLDLSDNSTQYTQHYMRVTTTPGVYAPSVETVPPASLLVSFPVLSNGSSYAHEPFELVNGRDYIITYNDEMNHTELGDAYLTIVGMGNVTGEYQVKYTIKPPMLYTVTIPASVTLPDNGPESTATLPITCTLQGPGLEVSVDVKSANDFTLGTGPDQCTLYGLFNHDGIGVAPFGNGEVARFVASSTPLEEQTITENLAVSIFQFYPLPEGEYTDTLTFTVHAEEKTESTN